MHICMYILCRTLLQPSNQAPNPPPPKSPGRTRRFLGPRRSFDGALGEAHVDLQVTLGGRDLGFRVLTLGVRDLQEISPCYSHL